MNTAPKHPQVFGTSQQLEGSISLFTTPAKLRYWADLLEEMAKHTGPEESPAMFRATDDSDISVLIGLQQSCRNADGYFADSGTSYR